MAKKDERPLGVLALGASAGGLEALQRVLAAVPLDVGVPILVSQHMDPTHVSHLGDALARATKLPIETAQVNTPLVPGHVYLCPADAEMELRPDGRLAFRSPTGSARPVRIDFLFESVARVSRELGIVAILSGTGSDGTQGALAVKRAGGTVIAESRESARHSGMPNMVINSGAVDFIKPAGEIGPLVAKLVSGEIAAPAGVPPEEFDAVLKMLEERRGTNFDLYREPTMRRRLHKRILAVGAGDIDEYLTHVRQHPDELDALFDTLLINVTEFFRDPSTWATFERDVLPGLVERVKAGETVRFWCAGCASGEEPYSVAILLAEALPSHSDLQRVKIFATDIDDDSLAQAREGSYEPARVENVSPERLERFFARTGTGFKINKAIRRMVIFGRHDLTRDPPIGRLDVLVCRNVLIYFDLPLQRRVLSAFHYAISPNGLLFLGKSEDIPRDERFEPIDRAARIFRSRGGVPSDVTVPRGQQAPDQRAIDEAVRESGVNEAFLSPLVHFILDSSDLAFLVLDEKMAIRLANVSATRLLAPAGAPLQGRGFVDVLRLAGATDLHAIEAVGRGRDAPTTMTLRLLIEGRRLFVDVTLSPHDHASQRGTVVIAHNVTEREETRASARTQARELQETIEELQTTNEEVQSANEELMTSNEELQSSNEELATVNEEFQSTNEELETTNEELQSTNAELLALNEEAEHRGAALEEMHRFADAYGAAGSDAVVRCDAGLRVIGWSSRAQEIFGHRRDKVLSWHLHSVDFRVDGAILRDLIGQAQSSPDAVESETVDLDRGKQAPRRGIFVVQAIRGQDNDLNGYLVLFKERTRLLNLEDGLETAQARFDALLRVIDHAVLVTDAEGKVLQMTDSAKKLLYEAGLDGPKLVWDLARDPAHRLQLRGAIIGGATAVSTAPPGTTDVRLEMDGGRVMLVQIVPTSAPHVPPLVLLRWEGPADKRRAP